MVKLLFITDFTESFAYALLKGIIRYSNQTERWVVCRMPPAYKKELGIKGVIKWAKKWGADVVIGQFEATDKVELFRRNGIVALAQALNLAPAQSVIICGIVLPRARFLFVPLPT